MKRALYLSALSLSLALAVALFPAAPARAQEPIKVGLLASLTTDFALIGILQKHAGVMAAEDFNAEGGARGRKIELVIEDSANSNTVALAGLNKTLAQKPVALLGPIWATQLFALFPTIQKEGIPTLATSGTRRLTQVGNRWFFRYFPHDGITKTAYTEFALNELKRRKVGILHVANEYGMSGRDIIVETLKRHGLTPAAIESHNATDKDMSAQLQKVKAAGADVILSQAHVADTALILKQQRTLGIDSPHVASSAASTPSLLKLVTEQDLDGIYVETAAVPNFDPRPQVQRWVKSYTERFKVAPDVFALLYYDMARMLFKAIREAGPDREKIRAWLAANRYEGLATTYKADAEGNLNHRALIIRFKGKTPEIVKIYDYSPR
ncbi:MAG: ABC transporter substrate-binding protein [Deltaproteobacteria bacterium]|nr:ABC transporter substrate-binding protein [Deltaproteobacteria bacterium]